MKIIQRSPKTRRLTVLAGVMLAGTCASAMPAAAQSFEGIQPPKSAVTLSAFGSFYVGGQYVFTDAAGPQRTGHIMVNQMYVQYMVPAGANRLPMVLVHGGGLSGKNYETQPDGRMGWAEYFVRKGSPTFVVDQAARARSSFDPTIFNKVRDGLLPPASQPSINRTSREFAWTQFRFGPSYGVPFANTLFPVKALDEFEKQQVSTLNALLPVPDSNFKALSDLAIKAKAAVLVAHSQSGRFPLEAALINSTGTKGLVLIEPAGGCNATVYTDAQIKKLATVPILAVFGDHLDDVPSWRDSYNNCNALLARVKAAGGSTQMLYPPDLGIFGNSHMLMNDKNSDLIAELILKWIDKFVVAPKVADKPDPKNTKTVVNDLFAKK